MFVQAKAQNYSRGGDRYTRPLSYEEGFTRGFRKKNDKGREKRFRRSLIDYGVGKRGEVLDIGPAGRSPTVRNRQGQVLGLAYKRDKCVSQELGT